MNIFRWISKRGWLPPESVEPIVPGQVWTYVPFNMRLGKRQSRYFVTVFRVEDGLVWYSMIPGPRYQDVAVREAEFRKLFRLIPDLVVSARKTKPRE
jgi:hypothetical protein